MTTEQRIAERIKQLEAERAQFVQDANVRLTAYDAAISELKRLAEAEKQS